MKKFLTWKNILILLLILGAGVGIYFLVRKTPLPAGLIQVNGRIEGDIVVISSKYSGKIKKLLVREGNNVTAGQVVARLDDPETRDKLAQAQQDLDSIIARARSAGQNVGLTAETGGAGMEQAMGQVAQARSSIEEARSGVQTAAANVKTASAVVSSASASLRQSREAVRRYSAQLQTAQANLESAQKTVDSAQAQATLSAANARRYTNLARERVVSERARDEYVTAATRDQAQLLSAKANADSARGQVASSESELRRSRDQVAASQADLERAQAQLVAARSDENSARARVATATGKNAQALGSLRQAQTSPTQVAISKSNQASALSQIGVAEAKVKEQRDILNSLFVTSPINGTIATRIRDTGEVVTAGSPILAAVDLDKLYLLAYVPESQIGKIRLGLPARVYVDAYPNQPFDAVVTYISSTAEFTPKEVQTPDERVKLVYAVKLHFKKNPNHRLTPGMPADAIIRWKESVRWQKPQF